MRFIERFFKEEKSPVIDVHPDFKVVDLGYWCFNREAHLGDMMNLRAKVRFSFDDATFLNSCPFIAKIGPNEDESVPGKYIGFAYGDDAEKLSEWASRFQFAELISGLDESGVSTNESVRTVISSEVASGSDQDEPQV